MKIENGKLIDRDGFPFNIHDYLATKKIYPRIYDYNTKNKAFINVHLLLKQLGVKNNNEHLQLFHQELLGIDPHDPTLPDFIKNLIMEECKVNVWYFLREVVRIPTGESMTYFDLNIASFTTAWLLCRRQNIFYELGRQIGKTFLLTTFLAWIMLFGGRKNVVKNIHHTKQSAIDNLNKVKETLNNLPPWMRLHLKEWDIKIDKKTGNETRRLKNILTTSDNAGSLKVKLFDNIIANVIVGGTKDSANRAGRGATANIYFIDEISHIKNNMIAFGSLQQSTTTAKIKAKKAGNLYGIWLLGTPGDLKTPHGKWMLNKIKNEYMPFTYKDLFLLDYTSYQLEDYINKRSISNFWHVKYDWDTLGFSDDWFFEKNRNEEVPSIRSESLLHWEESTDNSPFTRGQLASIESKSKLIDVEVFELDDFNTISIYPKEGEMKDSLENFFAFNKFNDGILIGIDVANGTGNDSSTMVFVDAKTLRVIATYKNNLINTDDFSILIIYLLENIFMKYDIKVAIGVERNNSGTSVIAKVKKYPHLLKYFIAYPVSEAKMKDLSKPADFDYFINNMNVRADIGLTVVDRIRTLFTDSLLFSLVSKHTSVYCVPDIAKELKGLIKVKRLSKTRIEHSPDTHDDLIFGSFHAYYPAYYGVEILKMNHGIIIDPTQWIIGDGVEILNNVRYTKRINQYFETNRDGTFRVVYFDTKNNREISEKEAKRIQKFEDENRSTTIYNGKETPVEEVPIDSISDGLEVKRRLDEMYSNVEINNYFPDEVPKNENNIMALYDQLFNQR